MHSRNSLRILLGTLAVSFLGSLCLAADDQPAKPNILFVFADDQCFATIASLGNSEIETPNLDQIAKRGVTFTHAYNQGSWSGAVCVVH